MKTSRVFCIAIVLCALFAGVKILRGQEATVDNAGVIEDIIAEIKSNTDTQHDYTTLFEDLNYYKANPLNINTADRSELAQLHFLNTLQINNFLNYRLKYGKLLTKYELATIEGFTKSDIKTLLPFITIKPDDQNTGYAMKDYLKYGTHELFLRSRLKLEKPDGYTVSGKEEPAYPGNRLKYYSRYKFHYKRKLYWGVTMEKDPGEQFFSGGQKYGFDFYSAHFLLNNTGRFKTIAAGDYQLKFGQGLVISSGMNMGKTPNALNIRKNASGLDNYSSTNENRFMRGAGATVNFGNYEVTGFVSYKPVDGNIATRDTAGNIQSVTSLPNSGVHATPQQLEDKDVVNELIYGGHIKYSGTRFKLGATFLDYQFDKPIKKKASAFPEYSFSGKSNYNAGIDYQFLLGNTHFFGETAICKGRAIASVNGVLFPLVPNVSLSVLHRYYQKEYIALYGGAFGENADNQNERGMYFGLQFHPYAHWEVSAYFDYFRFPWLDYRLSAPGNGYEFLSQVEYSSSEKFEAYLRLKRQVEPRDYPADELDEGVKKTALRKKHYIRYDQKYKLSERIRLKNRVQLSYYRFGSNKAETGYMAYQDIRYKSDKFPLTLYLRLAAFNTDSYSTRIYAYENDVLYAFSIPAYYSNGLRPYLVAKYEWKEALDFWIKLAQTYYADKQSIGSGYNKITGNTKTQLKFQLRLKF